MTLQTLIQTLRNRSFRKTSAFVEEMNRQFCEQMVSIKDGSLITMLYGVLRVDRHEFQWCSAGHPVPLLHDRQTDTISPLDTDGETGTPLGVDGSMRYHSHTAKLPPGSRLLLYTDGLVEAFSHGDQGNLFGEEGVVATMKRTAQDSVDEILKSLLDDSHNFTKGAGRHDDTSALLLERE